jgi:hypothetical protein
MFCRFAKRRGCLTIDSGFVKFIILLSLDKFDETNKYGRKMKKIKITLILLILMGLPSFAQYNKDILEMTMKQDTLHVVTTDWFLWIPFGEFHSIQDFIKKLKPTKVETRTFPDEDFKTYHIQIKNSRIHAYLSGKEDSPFGSTVMLTSGEIKDSIPMQRDIHLGLSKNEVFDKLFIPASDHELSEMNVLYLESGLQGAFMYFNFRDGRLYYIKIDSDCNHK